MNKAMTTAGIALALGVVWSAGPALAQTTGEKIEDKSRRAGDKMERAADKTGEKLHRAADKTEDKLDRAKDKADRVGDKAESTWDKTKDKAREIKNKVKANTTDKMKATTEKADVKSMQMALKDKGHDPGPADGVMGPRTRAALMDYQRKEGLTPTGRWDDETAMKLGVRTSATPSSDPAASVGTTGVPPAQPEDKTLPGEKPRRPASP
jgi:hypothetical protein